MSLVVDPSWLPSTAAQSGAALVAIVGGLLITRLVSIEAERRQSDRRLTEATERHDAAWDEERRRRGRCVAFRAEHCLTDPEVRDFLLQADPTIGQGGLRWQTQSPLAVTSPPAHTSARSAATRSRRSQPSTCHRVRAAATARTTPSPAATQRRTHTPTGDGGAQPSEVSPASSQADFVLARVRRSGQGAAAHLESRRCRRPWSICEPLQAADHS